MNPLRAHTDAQLKASRKLGREASAEATGAGLHMDDINKLVKQFEQISKMMKMMRGGKSSKLMQMFGK